MRTFAVREHEAIPVGGEPRISLSESEGSLLEKLKPLLPQNALTWERGQVRFANFCGLLQVGEAAIEILPKIDGHEHDRALSRQVVIRMLAAAGALTTWATGKGSTSLQPYHLLDVLIADFCHQVADCIRQGAIHTYSELAEDLGLVRGRIDFPRLSRRLTKERVPCQFEVYTEDNAHNRILKDVLRQLLRRARSAVIRSQVRSILLRFADVAPHVATESEAAGLFLDRTSRHWERVFERCLWFLKGLHPDVFSGLGHGLCLVFDMNRLFEAFVTSAMTKILSGTDFRVHVQGPQRALARNSSGAEVFNVKPDIVVANRPGSWLFIADAKWKRIEGPIASGKVHPGDVYQMLAYARRYEVRNVALIYPAQRALGPAEVVTFYTEPDAVRLHAIGIDLIDPYSIQTAVINWLLPRVAGRQIQDNVQAIRAGGEVVRSATGQVGPSRSWRAPCAALLSCIGPPPSRSDVQ